MSSHERQLVIRNHRGARASQFQADWAKLSPGQVYDLLIVCKHSCRSPAAELRARMRRQGWTIAAAPHEGGKGGAGRGPDRNLHVTIRVGGRSYHLRLGGGPTRLHVSSISR